MFFTLGKNVIRVEIAFRPTKDKKEEENGVEKSSKFRQFYRKKHKLAKHFFSYFGSQAKTICITSSVIVQHLISAAHSV